MSLLSIHTESQQKKLDTIAREGVFVRYDNKSKMYKVFRNDKYIIINGNVKYVESKPQEVVKNRRSHETNKVQLIANNSSQNLQI